MRFTYLALGYLALGLGILGVFLPLLPTTVFLLVAAWSFARSSRRLHDWLLSHPRLGPPLVRWSRYRCLSQASKRLATVAILLSFGFSAYSLRAEPVLVALLLTGMVALLVYLNTRATCPRDA